jgi:hypothetical protein
LRTATELFRREGIAAVDRDPAAARGARELARAALSTAAES